MAESSEGPRRSSPAGFFGRMAAAVQNGIEIARFGGLGEREPSPYAVVAEERHHRLRHYFPDWGSDERPPVLLVPPLMLSAEVWDVAPDSSAVADLREDGADPWVVDFGSPEAEEGGLDRTLSDHVVAVSRSVDAVREATGRDVHLMGYSQGGMFCYQAAAYRNAARPDGAGLASLVTFGGPVDMHRALPVDLPPDVLADLLEGLGSLQSTLFPNGIPSWATRIGFQLLDPVKTVRQRVEFARQLYDREALLEREGIGRFLDREGWVAFPGPALKDFIEQLISHNRMLQGGFVIDERTATLASITCPILAFIGETDSIAPAPTVRAIRAAAPQADSYEAKLPGGHFAMVVGSRSTEITWPTVGAWVKWIDGHGPRPENIELIEPLTEQKEKPQGAADQLSGGLSVLWNLGSDLFDDAARLVGKRFGALGRMSGAIAPQLPRLGRLNELRRDSPVSLGRMLEEQAMETPEGTFFLFEGRAHSYRDVNERIDNVVLGFLHCGVRQGDYVGVLMDTRPSAVTATLALSRLGAVPVLLRPDVPLSEQLAQAPVEHLLADPEHAPAAQAALGRKVLVLGGGGGPRKLPAELIDMEAIDPERVLPPAWYTPNPGLAGELGLVLITGDEGRLGANRVTNRRFATSAYGTASACALTSRDTVYCCSPTHHATGIMVCVGGALVSGARLAMAEPWDTGINPEDFWEDVRRYGVSVVFYTGAMLRFLVNAPDTPAEHHHPIRLFAGSGLPKGIWLRLTERFYPARVVEFYASTEGNAVLVNLTGRKAGSVGRPLPGGAELAVAAYDLDAGELVQESSGFAARCRPGEVGLLLGGVDRTRGEVEGRPLRGVFEPGDAWLSTRDLVRIDPDGDYWLEGTLADVVRTPTCVVPAVPIEEILAAELDFVDLAAVYGAKLPELDAEIPVAALTLRRGAKLDPVALRRKVKGGLVGPQRPLVVRVLDRLPTTAGHRVRKSTLRDEGLGLDASDGETLWLAPGEDAYVPLGRGDLPRLVQSIRGD
ncbi:MAG: AMP-binding protein [Deltaproteobacteria bacterium]|nr:AMP-binding protein [Deltaproteobacteria bacterium]